MIKFLKKLLFSNSKSSREDQAEVIGSVDSKGSKDSKDTKDEEQRTANKRKFPRVRPFKNHIFLIFKNCKQEVINISLGGIGVENFHTDEEFFRGKVIDTEIEIENNLISVKLSVSYIGEKVVGFSFLETPSDFQSFFHRIFEYEIQGCQLEEASIESTKQDVDGAVRWWSSGDKVNFFLREKNTGELSFELFLMGNVFMGGESSKLVMSPIFEGRFSDFGGSDILVPEDLDDTLRENIFKLISSVNNISEEQLIIIRNIIFP